MGVFAILSRKLFYVKSNKAKVTFMAADIQFHYIEKHISFDKFCYANKLYRLKTSALAIHKFCQNFVAFTTHNFLRGRFWAHACRTKSSHYFKCCRIKHRCFVQWTHYKKNRSHFRCKLDLPSPIHSSNILCFPEKPRCITLMARIPARCFTIFLAEKEPSTSIVCME